MVFATPKVVDCMIENGMTADESVRLTEYQHQEMVKLYRNECIYVDNRHMVTYMGR